jgi:dipeptidase E
MRRLLLASHGIGALPGLVEEDTTGLPLTFVPTAAGPEADSKPWVQADRRQAELLGFEVATLELASASATDVERVLADSSAVFVTGGNSFLLLWHARRTGFADLVPRLVDDGSLVYIGTSAGALLAGPDLAPAASLDNWRAVPELESSLALGMVPFAVLPHDQEPEFRVRHDETVAAHPDGLYIRLTDDRAVAVRGGDVEVVDSPLVT